MFRKSIGDAKVMNALCEASVLVRQIAAPETGKAALLRAYRRLGTWTYNRVKDVYYADPRVNISADEIDKLRAVSRVKRIEEKTNDPTICEMREQLALMAKHLQRIDPSFHYSPIETLCGPAHPSGRKEDLPGRTDGDEG